MPWHSSLTSYRPSFPDIPNVSEELFIFSYLLPLFSFDSIHLSFLSVNYKVPLFGSLITSKLTIEKVIPSLHLIQILSSDTVDYFLVLGAPSSSFGDILHFGFLSNTDCSFSLPCYILLPFLTTKSQCSGLCSCVSSLLYSYSLPRQSFLVLWL